MRYLKSFNEANGKGPNLKKIRDFCNKLGIEISQIHPDGTVDVRGDVKFDKQLKKIKQLPIKFGEISGDFLFYQHTKITTLEGFPHTVGGSFMFHTDSKNVSNLIGGPNYVGENYIITGCKITSLEGIASTIGGNLNLSLTHITDFQFAPKEVGGSVYTHGVQLSTLEGCPEIIGGDLFASGNFTSLKGLPKQVGMVKVTSSRINWVGGGWRRDLWDPTGLEDCDCTYLQFESAALLPLIELIDLFNHTQIEYWSLTDSDIKIEITKRFRDSLDYRYIRGGTPNHQLNLFRLKEALSEFDLDPLRGGPPRSDYLKGQIYYQPPNWKLAKDKTLQYYEFVDDNGEVVDFDGNPI